MRQLWLDALALPPYDGPAVWLHGDPHPGNLLVSTGGRLAAVIDFGDICQGDPATDLAIGWLSLDEPGREAYRVALDPDEQTWARARGWAVALTSAFLAHTDDNPEMRAIGEHAHSQLVGTPP